MTDSIVEGNDGSLEVRNQEIGVHQTIVKDHPVIDHQAFVHDLRGLPPISRIPPEVLLQIFFIASRDVCDRGVDWIALTHVCHEWRALALASPSLWSNPPFQNRYWAKEMLIRSKAAYLTIEAGATLFASFGSAHDLVEALDTCIPRIKCLKLEFPLSAANFLERLPKSAPALESLTLQSQAWYSAKPVVLQESSLLEMDHLRQIDLTRICINWNLHLPSSLTSLKLKYIHSSKLPTMAQFWDVLDRMPLLEILELIDALPTRGAQIPPDRTISLNRLQQLTLHTGIAETECVLQTIAYPHDANIDIHCSQAQETDYADLNEILRLLGQYLWGYPTRARIESLDIGHCSLGLSFRLNIRVPTNCDQGLIHAPPTFHFRAIWRRKGWDEKLSLLTAENMFTGIFRQFPFDSVKYVRLEGLTHKFSPATLLNTLGSLSLLQTVEVRLEPSVLVALQSHFLTSGTSYVSFPSLRQLSIVDTVFYNNPEHSRGKICVDDLIDCLIWRQQHGAAIKKLGLKLCYELDDDKIDRLKGVVSKVDWEKQQEGSWD